MMDARISAGLLLACCLLLPVGCSKQTSEEAVEEPKQAPSVVTFAGLQDFDFDDDGDLDLFITDLPGQVAVEFDQDGDLDLIIVPLPR
ncbi:MAG: hypothetical protein ACYSX0_22055 [Planctomycetota bacterium]